MCRSHQWIDVRPFLGPDVAEQVRRNRTVRRNNVAVALAQLHAHVGVQLQVERADLLPQPIELLARTRLAACRTSPATSRRCPRTRARARPCSTAPRIGCSLCASAGRWCASLPTPHAVPSRRATSAMIRVTSSMVLQCPADSPNPGTICPCRKSIPAAPRSSSARRIRVDPAASPAPAPLSTDRAAGGPPLRPRRGRSASTLSPASPRCRCTR